MTGAPLPAGKPVDTKGLARTAKAERVKLEAQIAADRKRMNNRQRKLKGVKAFEQVVNPRSRPRKRRKPKTIIPE